MQELFARLAFAKVLLATGQTSQAKAIASQLERALTLVGQTGARTPKPFIAIELARLARLRGDEMKRQRELREAHRLFTEMGAPIRAAEVAKELGLATAS